ncbi:hypothetical protein FQN53_006661 [Emmonsiellopsis sp. PD_33]|nr:hypothetical protein FQN53_006661 [Emmonsiellopsis sp. PD_33]KAK2790399.1 hypothetical protein FQN51_002486 [Onygenales sp. PD_10]
MAWQEVWRVPDGQKGNFALTVQHGQTVPFSWSGWGSQWTDPFLNKETTNDLWLTSYDYDISPFSKLIGEGIDISKAGSFAWSIELPDDMLFKTTKYVLRFKNAVSPRTFYNHTSLQIASTGFIVLNTKKATTTTSSSSSSSSSSTLSTTTSSTTTSATPPPQEPEASGLSTGAKAGIGVGSVVAGLALIALIAFALMRRRSRKGQQTTTTEASDYYSKHISEAPDSSKHFSEAPDDLSMAPVELPGSGLK